MCKSCNTPAPVLPYASDIERRITRKLVADILDARHVISVFDGESYALIRSYDMDAILGALNSTESDVLVIRTRDGQRVGYVVLIWGNGRDLISDNSANPATESLIAGAMALANGEAI